MNGILPERFADVYTLGDPSKNIKPGNLIASMVEAGYSPASANHGRGALSQACLDALAKRGIRFGKKYDPQKRAHLVRGKLLENVLLGQDKAVKSLELLGKDKELGMFTPDSQVGVIILSAPKDVQFSPIVEPPPLPPETDLLEE